MAKKKKSEELMPPRADEPQLITLEYVGPYGRRKRPAIVPGVGDDIFYLTERAFDQETSKRLLSTGEWQTITNKCKYIKLNGERCEKDRLTGESYCEIHMRNYAPGDAIGGPVDGNK